MRKVLVWTSFSPECSLRYTHDRENDLGIGYSAYMSHHQEGWESSEKTPARFSGSKTVSEKPPPPLDLRVNISFTTVLHYFLALQSSQTLITHPPSAWVPTSSHSLLPEYDQRQMIFQSGWREVEKLPLEREINQGTNALKQNSISKCHWELKRKLDKSQRLSPVFLSLLTC